MLVFHFETKRAAIHSKLANLNFFQNIQLDETLCCMQSCVQIVPDRFYLLLENRAELQPPPVRLKCDKISFKLLFSQDIVKETNNIMFKAVVFLAALATGE